MIWTCGINLGRWSTTGGEQMAQLQSIRRSEQFKVIARAVINWINSLTDALPPYYVAEGQLDMKGQSRRWTGCAFMSTALGSPLTNRLSTF